MKIRMVMLSLLGIMMLYTPVWSNSEVTMGPINDSPVEGMVTMIDLGAHKCIPCKMMAPILKKLKKEYDGKAAIVFLDVWQNKNHAKKYGIRAIPTQIFFDEKGKEVYRHTGFMDEKSIIAMLKKMGVE